MRYLNLQGEKSSEYGATLSFALALTLLFAGLLVILSQNQSRQSTSLRADSTGWIVAELAKAARLYVRNNAFDGGSLGDDGVGDTAFSAASLFALPSQVQEINFTALQAAGYLPSTIGSALNRTDPTGLYLQTVYGQNIRVFAANSPLNVDPSDPANFVVPTVYIVLEASNQVTPSILRTISNSINRNGITFAPPLFGDAGANISDDCDGSPAVAIWDSGCLNEADYDTTFGTVVGSFSQGDLLIPAWRVVELNGQIMSRFPQPGNANYATMLTDLMFGDCVVDGGGTVQELAIIEPDSSNAEALNLNANTEICRTVRDNDTSRADARVDILNASSVQVNQLIAADQNIDQDILTIERSSYVVPFAINADGIIEDDYDDVAIEADTDVQNQIGATLLTDKGNGLDIDDVLLLSDVLNIEPNPAAPPVMINGSMRVFGLKRADGETSGGTPDLADFEDFDDLNYTLSLNDQAVIVDNNLFVGDSGDTADIVVTHYNTGFLNASNLIDVNRNTTLSLDHFVSASSVTTGSNLNVIGDYFAPSITADNIVINELQLTFGGAPNLNTIIVDGQVRDEEGLTTGELFQFSSSTGDNIAILPQLNLNVSALPSNQLSRITSPASDTDASSSPGLWPPSVLIGGNLVLNSPLTISNCERDCPEVP